MANICDYKELINNIPSNNQSAKISHEIWMKRLKGLSEDISDNIGAVFNGKDVIELSRQDIISESDVNKKIIMTLMWGYPTGGRGKNIKNIIERIDDLEKIMPKRRGNLSKEDAEDLIKKFKNIPGLGISTWSKLLFFFEISIDSNRCQIFDEKIVKSLERKQINEFLINNKTWTQTEKNYYDYNVLVNYLANEMNVKPEQIELFLFYFNLNYKL